MVSDEFPLEVDTSIYPSIVHNKIKSKRRIIGTVLSKGNACEEKQKYFTKIMNKLIASSKLKTPNGRPSIVVSCAGEDKKPSARLVAGKYIVISDRITDIANSEDELAAIIGHELAHFTLAHQHRLIYKFTNERIINKSISRKLKKAHEREADLAGLKLMANAGYNPNYAITQLSKIKNSLQRPNTQHSHPDFDTRIMLLSQQIRSCKLSAFF